MIPSRRSDRCRQLALICWGWLGLWYCHRWRFPWRAHCSACHYDQGHWQLGKIIFSCLNSKRVTTELTLNSFSMLRLRCVINIHRILNSRTFCCQLHTDCPIWRFRSYRSCRNRRSSIRWGWICGGRSSASNGGGCGSWGDTMWRVTSFFLGMGSGDCLAMRGRKGCFLIVPICQLQWWNDCSHQAAGSQGSGRPFSLFNNIAIHVSHSREISKKMSVLQRNVYV